MDYTVNSVLIYLLPFQNIHSGFNWDQSVVIVDSSCVSFQAWPTLMVVAFVRKGLPVAVLQEHLDATPQQVLPARTHGRSQRRLVDLNQFTCRGGQTAGRKEGWVEPSQGCRTISLRDFGSSPESSCRVLKLSVLSMAVTRRATQIIHDWRSAGKDFMFIKR